MITLVILIISGIGAAIFATQNTQATSVFFGEYGFNNIPVYLITLVALLVGILVSYVIHIINTISDKITMYGKDGSISNAKKEVASLNKEIHKLELENTRLKAQLGQTEEDQNSM